MHRCRDFRLLCERIRLSVKLIMPNYTDISQYRNETTKAEIVQGAFRAMPLARVYHSKFEGPASIGRNTQIGPDVTAGKYFSMGEDCYFARCTIGRFCAFGARTAINPFGHPTDWLSIHEFQYHPDHYDWYPEWNEIKRIPRPTLFTYVTLGNDVWTGLNVTVLGGVSIGDGAIIAASSVVTRDVPPYAIVGGAPAKVLRFRFAEKTIARLQALRWWDLPMPLLSGLPFNEIDLCLDRLEQIRADYDQHVVPIEKPVIDA